MANRLARSQSLYLRKHAENPIDWWMWCDEAIATAKAEDKPIFYQSDIPSVTGVQSWRGKHFQIERSQII